MSDRGSRAAIYSSCPSCGCALGYQSQLAGDRWFCCGPCASSDRCVCGCRGVVAPRIMDQYVPVRRMYAARPPDELKRRGPDVQTRRRAFPFYDRRRGR